MLKSELRQIVREAINTLPEHLRIVLILREYEDLSYEEIASIIGCRVGTVKSRLFQAREMLKRKLSPYISI
jgi:RNA polymerase sigma-70 factor (ECF subfamily)